MKKLILITLLCFFSCIEAKAITDIELSSGELIPSFSKNIKQYNVYISDNINKIEISAIKEETDVSVENEGVITLDDGITYHVIRVIDNENKVTEYKLNIQRGLLNESEDNAYLRELIIEGIDLDFKYDVFEYQVNIDEDIEELVIDYTPFNLDSYTIQSGGTNLNKSKNIIEIKVISEDGSSSNTYKINVNKTIKTFNQITDEKNIFGQTSLTKNEKIITLFTIGILSLIVIIIFYKILFRKKRLVSR